MKGLHYVSFLLVVVGALNWGLIAFFNFNLVSTIFGAGTVLEKIVYAAVGVSAVFLFATHKGDCKTCSKMKMW